MADHSRSEREMLRVRVPPGPLRSRSTVGLMTLNHAIGVRFPAPQFLVAQPSRLWLTGETPVLRRPSARPSTQTGKATRSRAWCLWVQLPPRSFANEGRRWPAVETGRAPVPIVACRLPTIPHERSASVADAHLFGREEDRVRVPGGPLQCWGRMSQGRRDCLASSLDGFDSRRLHSANTPMVKRNDHPLLRTRSSRFDSWSG
jgi:hypothetical protein